MGGGGYATIPQCITLQRKESPLTNILFDNDIILHDDIGSSWETVRSVFTIHHERHRLECKKKKDVSKKGEKNE